MPIDLPADIYWHRMKYDGDRREKWLSYLSSAERDEMDRFGSPKRRREFLLGRAVLRELLARLLERSPGDVPVYQADDGAPEIHGCELQVSLTHSHGWAAAAAATRAVGIDMEFIQPRHQELYRQIVHEREMEVFEAVPCSHDERQILWWTLKEAALKAVRPARRLSLRDLRVDCTYRTKRAEVRVVDPPSRWTVTFDRMDNFYLAVAYPAETIPHAE